MALSFGQQLVFDAVHNDPGVTVDEVADETGLSAGGVRQTLAPLEDRGLVLALGATTPLLRFVSRTEDSG